MHSSKTDVPRGPAASPAAVRPDTGTMPSWPPGTIDTPMPRGGATELELHERARTIVPLGRMGTSSDVAEVVSFLLNERLTWMTGQTIWINGGDLMP